MRFYTKQHQFYCGIDLHARTMYLCLLNRDGELLIHRTMPAGPDSFLKAIAPSREDLVVCVACLFTWYWLADLCAREGISFVLGHALSMKAIHGGKTKNDKIDAHKIAVLLRGGMIPMAYVYPSEMRATRDLRRRRCHLMELEMVEQPAQQFGLAAEGHALLWPRRAAKAGQIGGDHPEARHQRGDLVAEGVGRNRAAMHQHDRRAAARIHHMDREAIERDLNLRELRVVGRFHAVWPQNGSDMDGRIPQDRASDSSGLAVWDHRSPTHQRHSHNSQLITPAASVQYSEPPPHPGRRAGTRA